MIWRYLKQEWSFCCIWVAPIRLFQSSQIAWFPLGPLALCSYTASLFFERNLLQKIQMYLHTLYLDWVFIFPKWLLLKFTSFQEMKSLKCFAWFLIMRESILQKQSNTLGNIIFHEGCMIGSLFHKLHYYQW
jgi:hypothetical protein